MRPLRDHKMDSDDIGLAILLYVSITSVLVLVDAFANIQISAPIGLTLIVACTLSEIFEE